MEAIITLLLYVPLSGQLHSRSFSSRTCSKPAIEPVNTEIINKWELLARVDQGENKEAETEVMKRAKSCHRFREHVSSSITQEESTSDEFKQDTAEWSCAGMGT
ncbi:hypothetical protein O6P43_031414 [Quillaja saponaria]|uniref:Uncharacterized protein n=1 Tax=Quillaja saponaria TaxID=32244 RepID=A0AAD7KVP4_QUISA|nr:hypothetical protein O6P43_031414 [Quillaja saponaria]